MDKQFEGKSAIVTGGASGIGAAIAEELAAGGAKVLVADLKMEQAEEQAKKIRDAGGVAEAFSVDVSKPEQVEAMVDKAVSAFGKLDLAVNNAGVSGTSAPVGEYPLDDWNQVINVNLNGVFYGCRYEIAAMEKTGGGSIVNIASILGSVGFANSAAYVTAKHGVIGLTKNAAIEYSAKGIRVNAVGPAFINTPLIESSLSEEQREGLISMHPIGRLGEADEVSALVCFLLSDRASFVTGSYHLADGAYTAQ
ncbi:SDR family NAD(P)-dependent oxidoreductase [Psychromarinibacter halotolerans]|uniref:SDR family NAD(P)-dependent oxidoreductase n=1 Tax=Psychromarinibacter halotolerans TaxID=1775175 RepID=A0ABV7GU70_9RHOB|nr:3-oxoacyl-ACP reductase FabG [Psychromarinibacter halotolerans]MDF0598361.1 3-oxoacyl-ACP reductase FabG [Psychromarinibacter halotolerans]